MLGYVTNQSLDGKTDEWLRTIAPFNQHDWMVERDQAALLVVDCQRFFLAPHAPILPRIQLLIDSFHAASRPVVFTRHVHKADGSDLGVIGRWWAENIIEGTPESEILPALEVRADDVVIRKNVYSSFVGTELDSVLRRAGVGDLVIAGVMTNLCCETAARDAFCRNYRVFFPADANGTVAEEMHVASLMNIGFGFGVVMRSRELADRLG
jgi:nicotinamidase-related amidase